MIPRIGAAKKRNPALARLTQGICRSIYAWEVCMKTLIAMVLVLLILAAPTGADPPPLRLAVDLVDGSRVIGVPENDSIRVRTDFAELSIPLVKIDSVTWKPDRENVTIRFHNEDVLTGGVVPEPLSLEALFGRATIGMEHVTAFQTLPPEIRVAPPIGDELMLYFPFDEKPKDNVVRNAAQDKHHGTVFGAAWTKEGYKGGAYHFSSNYEDRIEVLDDPALRLQELTLAAWVYPEDKEYSTWRGIITKTNSGSWSNGFGLARYPSSPAVNFWVNYYSGETARYDVPDNEWTHVAATYNGKIMAFFVNGVRVSEAAAGKYDWQGTQITHSEHPLQIGNAPSGYNWIGKIDEVMIFRRALSDREVKRIYELTP
jgi:hypothetical protein